MLRRLHLRRSSLIVCVASALAVLAVAAGGEVAGAAPRCFVKVVGPFQGSSGLVSRGVFRCSTSYRAAKVRVVLQRRVKGHWKKLTQVHRTMDIAAGRTYSVRTKHFPCHATNHFTRTRIRTFFKLATRDGSAEIPSAGDRALCTF